MRRVADILVEELINHGLKQVFMVTGGGAMHLNDAFARCKALKIFFNHHEQASAMAAESYCRLSNNPAVVNVTTGPGGINALNGVYGAYVDSIAMVVISGQIKRETMACTYPLPLRQLGDQEVDIISIVKSITKYAVALHDPHQVKEVVAKAVWLATHGRPGPVWIDVPIDVQGAFVDEASLTLWNAKQPGALLALRGDSALSPNTLGDFNLCQGEILKSHIAQIIYRLHDAQRPVLLGGTGVHIAGQAKEFRELGALLGIPTVGGWNAYDLVPNSHPSYTGRPGTVGDRPGNFTVQNADFLLTLGCRLNIRQISYNWHSFAPHAWKVQVDIDPAELAKPTLSNDLAIHADLRDFIPAFCEALRSWKPHSAHVDYLHWCQERVKRYPVLQSQQVEAGPINPYYFMDRLFSALQPGDVVVAANATAAVVSSQVGILKENIRLYSNSGCASMGYDLPAAIGAVLTGHAKRLICLAGDGSIMMNLQELQSIIGNQLPILIFLLNNNGYLSIRLSQSNHFPDNRFGTEPENGINFPNFTALAQTMGFAGHRLERQEDVESGIQEAFTSQLPALYEVMLDPTQEFVPKLASRVLPDGTMESPSLEDMAPFLSPGELKKNIL